MTMSCPSTWTTSALTREEGRREVVTRHLDQTVTEGRRLVERDRCEPGLLVDPEQDRPAVRVGEGRERLPHRLRQPTGRALGLDPGGLPTDASQCCEDACHVVGVHVPHLITELHTC